MTQSRLAGGHSLQGDFAAAPFSLWNPGTCSCPPICATSQGHFRCRLPQVPQRSNCAHVSLPGHCLSPDSASMAVSTGISGHRSPFLQMCLTPELDCKLGDSTRALSCSCPRRCLDRLSHVHPRARPPHPLARCTQHTQEPHLWL